MRPGNTLLGSLHGPREVTIPDGTQMVGDFWLSGSSIESVEIPASVREIRRFAFSNCRQLGKVVFRRARAEPLSPSRPEESKLRVIGMDAFSECTGLKGIEFPDGLEEIGIRAFGGSGLESAEMPPSVKVVRQAAFSECKSLRRVVLNEGLEALGTDEVRSGDSTWRGVFERSAVENVELPSTLKRIEYSAFRECKGLRHITLPDRLECIGKACFDRSALESVRFPPALRVIEDDAFCECESLRKVKFSEGLEKICRGAFLDSAIESAEFPASLRVVCQAAFAKCQRLRAVRFSEGIEVLGSDECSDDDTEYYGVFEGSAIERVELPPTLRRIERAAFCECRNLKRAVLPEGLEYVGDQCFSDSGIEEITIPRTLTGLGEEVFGECGDLRVVRVEEGCAVYVHPLVGDMV